MYHRFGEDKYPSTNVTENNFYRINYVLNNKVKILELEEVIEILNNHHFMKKQSLFLLMMHMFRFTKLPGQYLGIIIFR